MGVDLRDEDDKDGDDDNHDHNDNDNHNRNHNRNNNNNNNNTTTTMTMTMTIANLPDFDTKQIQARDSKRNTDTMVLCHCALPALRSIKRTSISMIE